MRPGGWPEQGSKPKSAFSSQILHHETGRFGTFLSLKEIAGILPLREPDQSPNTILKVLPMVLFGEPCGTYQRL
jgi:hypothetical protein